MLSKNPSQPLSTQHPALSTTAVILFLATRLPLLFWREIFFDELFTRWIAAKSFAGIVGALRYDSGPPLFYFLVHALGNPPLMAVRAISLIASAVTLGVLLKKQAEWAAIVFAVLPPAVLFAVDARSYALCAMFVTLAIFWYDEKPVTATASIVLAAYSHYYGALFFPLLLKKPKMLLLAALLFAPGFWLAAIQPAAARAWMTIQWPDALFTRPPLALAIVGAILLLACFRPSRYALIALVPLGIALRTSVYVPLRFESVIAAPLALLVTRAQQRTLIGALAAVAGVWSLLGIIEHRHRPPDPYREAADFVAANAGANPVVASGYLYLETVVRRPAIALPPEQALHPGWRAAPHGGVSLPAGGFWWIGERAAPELALIRSQRATRPLFVNARAAVIAVH